jgi:Na+/H+-translocating membrane pyrophosphatase
MGHVYVRWILFSSPPNGPCVCPLDPLLLATKWAMCMSVGSSLPTASSALSGYIGLYTCVRSNARVASAARVSYTETMRVAMCSGEEMDLEGDAT